MPFLPTKLCRILALVMILGSVVPGSSVEHLRRRRLQVNLNATRHLQPTPCGLNATIEPFCLDPTNSSSGTPMDPGNPLDILIIGSGFAGLGAAREIKLWNDAHDPSRAKKYMVLEGATQVGGRGIAGRWLAGGNGNPLYDMMWKLFPANSFEHQNQNWESVRYFDGLKNNVRNRIRRQFYSALECAESYAEEHFYPTLNSYSEDDVGLFQAMKDECGWEPDSGTPAEIEAKFGWRFYDIDWEYLFNTSTLYGLPDPTFVNYQDVDVFLTDGSGADLVAGEFDYHGMCDKICLETTVTKIYWDKSPIRVVANVGGTSREYYANQVVSTLSVGALKEQHSSLFQNSLPANNDVVQDKIEAMNNVWEVGEYAEIVYQFHEDLWTKFQRKGLDREELLLLTFPDDAVPNRKCNWFQVYDTRWDEFHHGSKSLVCFVMTDDLEGFDWSDTDGEVKDLLEESLFAKLQEVYPGYFGTFPSTFVRCNPGLGLQGDDCYIFAPPGSPNSDTVRYRLFNTRDNDLWGGSYANWKPMGAAANIAARIDDYNEFKAPLDGQSYTCGSGTCTHKVFWGGTATCQKYWEFMHGGLLSGIRDGKLALEADGEMDPPDTPEDCDF